METETCDMEYENGYKRLNAYIQADELVLEIYEATRRFPKEELFGLTSQMRRCAVSVPANIVEGYGRKTEKDKIHFYYIARGSLNELEYYIDLAHKLEYLGKEGFEKLKNKRDVVGRLLFGLINVSKDE